MCNFQRQFNGSKFSRKKKQNKILGRKARILKGFSPVSTLIKEKCVKWPINLMWFKKKKKKKNILIIIWTKVFYEFDFLVLWLGFMKIFATNKYKVLIQTDKQKETFKNHIVHKRVKKKKKNQPETVFLTLKQFF